MGVLAKVTSFVIIHYVAFPGKGKFPGRNVLDNLPHL